MKYLKTYEQINQVNSQDLISAAVCNDLQEVKKLIRSGTNLDLQDNYGSTALILASYNNYIEIVKELIKAGANVDLQDVEGNTALIWTSYNNYIEIVKELIKAGADWNIKDNDNNNDFLDYLEPKDKKQIIEEFPEEYKNYLMKKDAEKYNL